ncbi:SEC-C metal-binding domain-containing protein [Mucilaginibacter kameinonensis]|uniref:SEC-C metal-binding domain-containing protein n=1 Tax=Mucilaginibacter kameinonensis TaxID=452286 RepID=UPI000EF7813D|nr:SEC-C metal-binding domain-containing protein [Mucilaginibacter kameinonensis]
MNIEQILRTPQQLRSKAETDTINTYLTAQLESAIAAADEPNANKWALLSMIFEAQMDYLRVYALFESEEYYAAWCLLERIEIAIKGIFRLYQFVEDEYRIKFIFEYIRKLQSLFPYKVFGSSEYIKEIVRCGICNELVTLRKRCGHVKGQLYMGKMCVHEIEQSHFVGMSIVDVPFNKYSVMGVTSKTDDSYHYPQIEYLMSVIDHPFNEWQTKNYKIFKPHREYQTGRNEKCPCGSSKKYKSCCLTKPGIETDHTDFLLTYPTLKSKLKMNQLKNRK